MVTDKWQKFTRFAVTRENLERLGDYCDEFLVHGVDAEVLRKELVHSQNDNFCLVTYFCFLTKGPLQVRSPTPTTATILVQRIDTHPHLIRFYC